MYNVRSLGHHTIILLGNCIAAEMFAQNAPSGKFYNLNKILQNY